jgi:very-short-patch-repair endonuclease
MTLPYNPRLKERARKLRNNSTLAEILLWNQLKRGKMLGYDFHRQKPIDEFVVDFFCPRLSLIIEIDGESHIGKEIEDSRRQERLESFNLKVLRFDDMDVKKNMDGVLKAIRAWIINRHEQNGD